MSDGGTLPGGEPGCLGVPGSHCSHWGEGRVRVARLQEAGGGQPECHINSTRILLDTDRGPLGHRMRRLHIDEVKPA